MHVLLIAIAPAIVLLLFFNLKDKYVPESKKELIKAFIAGCLITIPVFIIGSILLIEEPGEETNILSVAYTAFIVAGFVEEGCKYGILMLLFWKNKHFNRMYDGIVYAVFVSLGFATIENILYVLDGGLRVAFLRAITAVPGHALFGIVMGYYCGVAKLAPPYRKKMLIKAFILPMLFHGLYNFMLISKMPVLLLLIIPVMLGLWIKWIKSANRLAKSATCPNNINKS